VCPNNLEGVWQTYLPVAIFPTRSSPEPTTGIRFWNIFFLESFQQWSDLAASFSCHLKPFMVESKDVHSSLWAAGTADRAASTS
jgi:hypothetical protein